MLSIDRRTIPGENTLEVQQEFQALIDECAANDPEFKASISIKTGTEATYTGLEITDVKDGAPWKISQEHPLIKAASKALTDVGQEVKYDHWVFGTDLSVNAGIYKKPCVGYSPMQEQYAHTPYDKVRIDYMLKALEGNVSIFLSATTQEEDISIPIE